MPTSDFVSVNVLVANPASPTQQNFGVPMVASYHTFWADRYRVYPSSTALSQMVTDGFSTFGGTYKAVSAILSQSPTVSQVVIGRRTSKPLQTLTLTFTDSTQGNGYNFTLVGSDGVAHAFAYMIPASATPTSIASAILALITAITGYATSIGTATAATGTITIARTDGAHTDIQNWSQTITLADTTADPGIAADLAAILAANPNGWYAFGLASNSPAEILAAATWAEATGQGGKVFFCNSSDSQDGTSATTDIATSLQTRGFRRTYWEHNGSQLLSYTGLATAGAVLPLNPGSYQIGWMSKAGVPADTDASLTETQALIINSNTVSNPGNGGKFGNYYKLVSGQLITWPGCTPSGQFMDITIFIDWLKVNMQSGIASVLKGLPKVPFTDQGIGVVKDEIKKWLKVGASPDYGGIDPASPIVVTAPLAASLTQAQRASRNLSGLNWSARLSGAVLTVGSAGSVYP